MRPSQGLDTGSIPVSRSKNVQTFLPRLTGQIFILECDVRRRKHMTENRYYVYILQSSSDKKLYIGFTTNLKQRLQAHAQGKVQSTKNRRFLKLVHYEYFINEADARA